GGGHRLARRPAMSAAVEVRRGPAAGAEPVQLSSLRDYTDCKTTISIAELYAIHEKDLKTRPQDFGRILRNRVLPGALIRAEDYVHALRWRSVLAREQAQALKRFDALLTAGALNVADPADPNQPDRLVSSPSITRNLGPRAAGPAHTSPVANRARLSAFGGPSVRVVATYIANMMKRDYITYVNKMVQIRRWSCPGFLPLLAPSGPDLPPSENSLTALEIGL